MKTNLTRLSVKVTMLLCVLLLYSFVTFAAVPTHKNPIILEVGNNLTGRNLSASDGEQDMIIHNWKWYSRDSIGIYNVNASRWINDSGFLMLLLPLDQINTSDFSTRGNDAKNGGAISVTNCLVNGCFSFGDNKGGNDNGTMNISGTFGFADTDNITMMAWVFIRANSGNAETSIIAMQNADDSRAAHLTVTGTLELEFGGSGAVSIDSTTGIIGLNRWVHVAASYNGSGAVMSTLNTGLYIDGVEQSGDTLGGGGAPDFTGVRTVIGSRFASDPDGYADANFDEIQIYNKSLSLKQISEIYNAGRGGASDDLGIVINESEYDGFKINYILEIIPHDRFGSGIPRNSTFIGRLNISIFDEFDRSLIDSQSVTLDIIGDTSSSNFSTSDGSFDTILAIGEYRITYDANKFTKRDFYVNILNETNQSVDLYLLSITNGTDITFTVQDSTGNTLENATIRLKKFFISQNAYTTVAMSRTNVEGKTIIDVDFNDAFYETLTTFGDFSLRTVGAKIISTTLLLSISLLTDPFISVDEVDDVITSISFNNNTQTWTYVFTSMTGTSKTGTLTVTEITPTSETIACNTTVTSSGSTLLCQVNTTTSRGYFTAIGSILSRGRQIETNKDEQSGGETFSDTLKETFGSQGDFMAIIIAGTLAGLGAAVSPALAIIMFIVGLGIVNFFGFTVIKLSVYVSFVIAGLLLIWKMKK